MRMHSFFHRAMHARHGFESMQQDRCRGHRDEGRNDAESFFAGRNPFGGRHGGEFFGDWNGPRGGGRRGGGRMFGHGDLKLLLLALIEQQPRHGYEMIRTIEDMFHGHYSPSPGAIYPTLTMLEDMGHAQVESEASGRKLYAITDAGRAFLDENRAAVEAVMQRTEQSARAAARMAMPEAVHRAMHAIRHAMLMHGVAWTKAEAQRVAAILERAAGEIASGTRRD